MLLQRNFKKVLVVVILLYTTLGFFSIALLEGAFPDVPGLIRSNARIERSLQKITASLVPWDQTGSEQRITFALSELKTLSRLLTDQQAKARLEPLEQLLPKAIEGDSLALLKSMEILEQSSLQHQNKSKDFADRIKRASLGTAWTLVLLALFGLGITVMLMFRFKQRVLDPFCDLVQLFEDWKRGNRHRRFNTHIVEGEIRDSLETLNEILDQSQAARPHRSSL